MTEDNRWRYSMRDAWISATGICLALVVLSQVPADDQSINALKLFAATLFGGNIGYIMRGELGSLIGFFVAGAGMLVWSALLQ